MTAPTCKACTRPVGDGAYLCQSCTERLARDLGDIGALAEELQTTRLRQSRTGGQATGIIARSSERPLPWDQRAAEAAEVMRSTVVAWVRVVLEESAGLIEGPTCRGLCPHQSCVGIRLSLPPIDTLASMGSYLLGHLEAIRHHDAADECADEIGHVVQMARHVIDRNQEKTYAGPCREQMTTDQDGQACCLAELYYPRGAKILVCPHCATEHTVEARHAWLIAIAQDQLVTIPTLSRFLSAYGEPLNEPRIRQWVARKQLVAHSKDRRGQALYRVSEVVALVDAMPATRQRQAAS